MMRAKYKCSNVDSLEALFSARAEECMQNIVHARACFTCIFKYQKSWYCLVLKVPHERHGQCCFVASSAMDNDMLTLPMHGNQTFPQMWGSPVLLYICTWSSLKAVHTDTLLLPLLARALWQRTNLCPFVEASFLFFSCFLFLHFYSHWKKVVSFWLVWWVRRMQVRCFDNAVMVAKTCLKYTFFFFYLCPTTLLEQSTLLEWTKRVNCVREEEDLCHFQDVLCLASLPKSATPAGPLMCWLSHGM